MRKNILPRALWVLPVLMTCMACAVALETDYEVEKSFTKRSSLDKTFVISASVEESADETKTQLSGTDVVWKTGDKIRIFDASHLEGVEYTLNEGDGQKTATFTGGELAASGPYYAVYPSSVGGALNGESVTFNIPNTQALAAGTFGDKANIAFAKVADKADAFKFKNVLGAVKIQLSTNTTVTDVRIETKGTDEVLWGEATVGMNDGGEPVISNLTNTAYDKQIVTASGSASGKVFYVMVPPGTLASGFVVYIKDNASKAMVKSAAASAANKVARSTITPMPEFTYEAQLQSAFLALKELPFGYFGGINPGGTLSTFVFDKTTGQYARKVGESTRTFRIQDFSAGKMYEFVTPKTLELDTAYEVSVESVVGSTYTAPASTTFKLVQKTANAGWFVSSDNTKGFIISLED